LRSTYKRHLDAAKVLQEKKLYREAFLSLQLSVECFLKYAFCLVRFKVWGGNELRLKDVPPFYHSAIREYDFSARRFEHNVSDLIRFLLDNVADIDRDLLQRLSVNLRSRADWINYRYGNPKLLDETCRKVFPVLLNAFEELLAKQFGGLA